VEQENPAVAAVERILASAGSAGALDGAGRGVGIPVDRALWICACISDAYGPVWLVTDTRDRGIEWRRVPDRVDPLDLVDTRLCGGGHTDPVDVLRWLGGDAASPFRDGDGSADAGVIGELRTRILRTA